MDSWFARYATNVDRHRQSTPLTRTFMNADNLEANVILPVERMFMNRPVPSGPVPRDNGVYRLMAEVADSVAQTAATAQNLWAINVLARKRLADALSRNNADMSRYTMPPEVYESARLKIDRPKRDRLPAHDLREHVSFTHTRSRHGEQLLRNQIGHARRRYLRRG